MLLQQDLAQIKLLGITEEEVNQQLTRLKKGVSFVKLNRPAMEDDGIIELSEEEIEKYVDTFENDRKGKTIFKFVPASGAASRMFKSYFSFVNEPGNDLSKYPDIKEFIDNLNKFAVYEDLNKVTPGGLQNNLKEGNYKTIVNCLLAEEYLAYGKLPKGLLAFHKYSDGPRTAFEEHLEEGAGYAAQADGTVNLHFTISPDHANKFQQLIDKVLERYQAKNKVKYDITFSYQLESTNTIAVDMQDEPFRLGDGSILFRPGGHGALLNNLNNINADIIFIKNIDNVLPDRLKPDTTKYKKALAGLLIYVQKKTFSILKELDIAENNESISQAEQLITNDLKLLLPAGYESFDKVQKTHVYSTNA
ncbi:MAG: DUF4301 family protein [Bacteroidales bacterium]|nr:DUF4301 family protein [Bacteroidales bacterium]